MKIGLTQTEALDLPFEVLMSYIAIEQIKNEGAEQKKSVSEEEAEFMRLLDFR